MINRTFPTYSKWIFLVALAFVSAARAEDETKILRAERGGAGVLAFSPDGKRLAAGGHYKDRSYLWDIETEKTVAELRDCGTMMTSVGFSPDGKTLVTAGLDMDKSQWRIVLWNGKTGKRVTELPANIGWRAAISPDSKTLAVTVLSGPVALFQLPKADRRTDLKTESTEGAEAIAFAPSGKLLATGHKATIRIADPKTGKAKSLIQAGAPVQTLAFAFDSKRLAYGTEDGTVAVYDVEAAKPVWSRKNHEKEIRGVVFTSDGKRLVSASHDKTVRSWEAENGEPIRTIEGEVGSVESVAVSPDDKLLAVGHSGGIALWSLTKSTGGERGPATTKRPREAKKFGGHTFAVYTDHVPWQVSRRRCEKLGGHLATFETPPIKEFVLKLCREANQSLWVGATDEEEEGQWLWVTGRPVAEADRADWKLDNHEQVQHWLCYWSDFSAFADAFGGERMGYICEWDD